MTSTTTDPGSAPPASGIFGLDDAPDDADVVLIGVPWEATTSYGRGTAQAPNAIRVASRQLDLFDIELGAPYRRGISLLPRDEAVATRAADAAADALKVIAAFDAGGEDTPEVAAARTRVNDASAWLNGRLQQQVGGWLDRGKLVGVVGGDHSVAFGPIAATAVRHPGMGVLQFDAHADLRVAYQGFRDSHASVMQRVLAEVSDVARIVSVGVRDLCEAEHREIAASPRLTAFFDADIAQQLDAGEPFITIARRIAEALPPQVYVSFDVDGLDPQLCPHAGTPVPGGLRFHQAMAVLRAVVASGRQIVGFDLCEVAPGPTDEWDANVGARLLYKLIGYALKSQQRAQ